MLASASPLGSPACIPLHGLSGLLRAGAEVPMSLHFQVSPASWPQPQARERAGGRLFIPQGHPERLAQAGEGKGDTALDPGSWKRPEEVNRGRRDKSTDCWEWSRTRTPEGQVWGDERGLRCGRKSTPGLLGVGRACHLAGLCHQATRAGGQLCSEAGSLQVSCQVAAQGREEGDRAGGYHSQAGLDHGRGGCLVDP